MNDTQDLSKIALQIKSLEQRTTSVTLPRTASVLQLKQEIQIVFDVESNRQRLIFQGKVLKDDKNLDDYANLDNGKVIHLVIRPHDAPSNPMNDNPTARPTRTMSGRLPMMEGYAFITLDSTEMSDNHSLLSSVLNGLNRSNTESPHQRPTETETPRSAENTTNSNRPSLLRPPFAFSFGHREQQRSPLTPSALGFPPSVEVRLARTLASMRNVRRMLHESTQDIPSVLSVNSTTEQLQEVRNSLRADGTSQLSQVGMALDELADLTMETVPRLREIAQSLRQTEQEGDVNRRVLYTSRIVQGMSLINHFMGSVLGTVDIDSRRSTPTPNTQTTRGDTQVLRTSAPTVASSEVNPEASTSSSGLKRKDEEEESEQPIKKAKQEDGKGKKKTD